MRQREKTMVLCGAMILTILLPGLCWADDVRPPTWRGAPNSTVQGWEFSMFGGPVPPWPPEFLDNPCGMVAGMEPVSSDYTWHESYGSRQGVVELHGTNALQVWDHDGSFGIGNCDQPDLGKEFWVQVTLEGSLPPMHYEVIADGVMYRKENLTPVYIDYHPDGWITVVHNFEIPACPSTEWFEMWVDTSAGAAIDQVVIDTLCREVSSSLCDLNGDGLVNLVDVGIFASDYLSGSYVARSDLNGDGVLNLTDVGLFAECYLNQ